MKIKRIFYFLKYFLIISLLSQLLFSCATFNQEPTVTETKSEPGSISIKAVEKIISPNNDKMLDDQVFTLENKSASTNPIVNWTLTVSDTGNNIVFKHQSKSNLPAEYIWNGKGDDNKVVADGEYKASLEAFFINGSSKTEKSNSFIVDATPPQAELKRDKEIFSPDNDGIDDKITFSFANIEEKSGIKNWELVILSPYSNTEFIMFSGEGEPKDKITWNGISKDGKLVESTEEYPMIMYLEDEVGNKNEKQLDPVLVDILVIKLADGRYKIRISNIKFKPNQAVMTEDKKNFEILDKLTTALKKFGGHKILIEGYANKYSSGLNEKRAYELSEERARLVTNELVERGIEKGRMTIEGKGFENPIIPLKGNMTKEQRQEMAVNRRVEFYLEK